MNSLVHDCSDELHTAKLRVTPARLGVLEVLEHSDTPIDVATIIKYLTKHKVAADDVTVFRILNTFTKKELVKTVQFNEGKFRYEYAGKPEHHHFICEHCGDIEDVEDCNVGAIVSGLLKKKGAVVTRHSLEFFGLCRMCAV